MSMYTQWFSFTIPEYEITFMFPMPDETRSGQIGASARMSVSATMFPGQKRPIVAHGNVGFAREPRSATMRIGRTSPEFWGTYSCVAVSSRIERSVT
jgi:hypothetical protein